MQHDVVKDYYGQVLKSSADLKTSACCDASPPPPRIRAILSDLHPEVTNRYYGCGLVVPEALEGARVIDLGCGTGRDVYLLAALAGPGGHVVGVDMTEEQLAIARDALDWQMARFGFGEPNVSLLSGYIEALDALGLDSGSFDLVVSNCVVNLATDKAAVLKGVYDLLKPGGEMYFSDVYADRRLTDEMRADPVLYGECLSGALYTGDFRQMAREAGFACPRRVSTRAMEVHDPEIAAKLGGARFVSEVWRLFKHGDLEPGRENFGQTATYLGGLDGAEAGLSLDETLHFIAGEAQSIDANTAVILRASRYAPYFEVTGDTSRHLGAFEPEPLPAAGCGPAAGGCCG
ncbi:MAG: methyltransferase domain-containing protein [Pseudomonadota bacterium]